MRFSLMSFLAVFSLMSSSAWALQTRYDCSDHALNETQTALLTLGKSRPVHDSGAITYSSTPGSVLTHVVHLEAYPNSSIAWIWDGAVFCDKSTGLVEVFKRGFFGYDKDWGSFKKGPPKEPVVDPCLDWDSTIDFALSQVIEREPILQHKESSLWPGGGVGLTRTALSFIGHNAELKKWYAGQVFVECDSETGVFTYLDHSFVEKSAD